MSVCPRSTLSAGDEQEGARSLDAMTDEEITAAAESDPDNPPPTDEGLERVRQARWVQAVRSRTALSQSRFAEVYRINVARLRDLEQGRTQPGSAMLVCLTVIAREPAPVKRRYGRSGRPPSDQSLTLTKAMVSNFGHPARGGV